jgi:hypothetical protein
MIIQMDGSERKGINASMDFMLGIQISPLWRVVGFTLFHPEKG